MFKKNLLALLMTLSLGSLAADFSLSNGQFGVWGEYLYFRPSIDDTYFVIDSPVDTTFPNGNRIHNDPHFRSGYRVGASYSFCDCNSELLIAYAHLGIKRSKTVDGAFLWATEGRADLASIFEGYAGSATSDLRFTYQRLDALYSQEVYNCCGLDFAVQVGIEAAELRYREEVGYASALALGEVFQRSRTEGVGPQVGFALGYDLFSNDCQGTLALKVLTSGSLLAADTRSKAENFLTPVGGATATLLDVRDRRTWRVIPALHTRVGLNYDMAFECLSANIEVGYEFSSYLRALTRTDYPDDVADGLSRNHYDNFDVQGLYVALGLKF
jgi:hypothetical protein